MKNKQGVALISVLAITAMALIIMTAAIVVAVINAKIGFNQFEAQKTLSATNSVLQDGILRYLRDRNFTNPYPDWTQNCLQIQNFTCKMELVLIDENRGTIQAWGKINDKLRHLQAELTITEDKSVSISGEKEIY